MEYINGIVRNTPMQHPMNPTIDAIMDTITSPKRTKGCFDTITILDFMASKAFKSPKIIRGIVRKVKKETIMLINDPTILIPV